MKTLLLSLAAALAFFSTNASIKTIELTYQTTDFHVVEYGGVAHVDTHKYINETISTNRHIIAGHTFVGNDVTGTKPEGPVEVITGNLSINVGNGVVLKNNFKVDKGATLHIYKP